MGVYIEAMEMPNNGETITITICGDGIVFEEWKEPGSVFKAVPVPPHGRLIDADAIRADIDEKRPGRSYEDAWALTVLDNAPTIIQAEEGKP